MLSCLRKGPVVVGEGIFFPFVTKTMSKLSFMGGKQEQEQQQLGSFCSTYAIDHVFLLLLILLLQEALSRGRMGQDHVILELVRAIKSHHRLDKWTLIGLKRQTVI